MWLYTIQRHHLHLWAYMSRKWWELMSSMDILEEVRVTTTLSFRYVVNGANSSWAHTQSNAQI